MRFNFQRKFLAVPYAMFLIGFVILPLFIIVYYAFTNDRGEFSLDAVNLFFQPVNGSVIRIQILLNSLWYAFLNTILCLVIGYPVAMILANKKYNRNAVIVLLFIMPMWINFVIRTWATADLLLWLGVTALPNPNFPLAVIIGLVYNFLPFVVLPLYTTMLKMDKSQIEAAQDLGATPFQTFYKVIIPMTMPGIVAASTMVFMPTISSQVIPNILSRWNIILYGEAIASNYLRINRHIGSFMAFLMLLILGIVLLISKRFNKKAQGQRTTLW
jgi:spermidine/putrescine transport system permease protein